MLHQPTEYDLDKAVFDISLAEGRHPADVRQDILSGTTAPSDEQQPWPRAQRMPLAMAGGRPQPWHHQAIAEYGAATSTELEPNPTIPGGYTATQVNWAITWWNERVEAEQEQDGGLAAVQRFADAWRESNARDRAHLPSEDGRRYFGDSWFQISGTDAKLTEPQLRAVLALLDDRGVMDLVERNEQLRDERDIARSEVARAWEDLTTVREERDALAARVAELEAEREADTWAVARCQRAKAGPDAVPAMLALDARFADRIEALDASVDGGVQ